MSTHQKRVNDIWEVKEILRDHYRRHEYGQVILPLTVLRRLESVPKQRSKSRHLNQNQVLICRTNSSGAKRIAHRVKETVSIGLEAGEVEPGETFGERTDRPDGERIINLEEVRSIIERINDEHATDIEVLESGKAVTLISTSEGLAELVADNDIDDIVDTEWKRLMLLVLPQLEDHGNEFWAAIRGNPQMLEDFGRDLVRAACEALSGPNERG